MRMIGKIMVIAVLFLAVAACGEREVRKVTLDPTVLALAGYNAKRPQIELTAVAWANNRTPTPEPTSIFFWERPDAEKTAVASCPEGSSFGSIIKPSPTPVYGTPDPYDPRWQYLDFIADFPHGLVTCRGPRPSSGFLSNMPGFSILLATPVPRDVDFSDLVPTVTPTPP